MGERETFLIFLRDSYPTASYHRDEGCADMRTSNEYDMLRK